MVELLNVGSACYESLRLVDDILISEVRERLISDGSIRIAIFFELLISMKGKNILWMIFMNDFYGLEFYILFLYLLGEDFIEYIVPILIGEISFS